MSEHHLHPAPQDTASFEAAAQLLMCERMDSLRAAQSAADRGGPAGVAGELNGTGAGDGDGGSGENEQSAGRGSEACSGTMKRIIPQMWTSAGVHPDSAPNKLGRIGVAEIVVLGKSGS